MYELKKLPYAYSALEPWLDAETMELHHAKHHQTYVNKLNETLAGHEDLAAKEISDLLRDLSSVPENIRGAVRNHGGGVWNHDFFWDSMESPENGGGGEPGGQLSEALTGKFGGVSEFKEQFTKAALNHFGSGWAWLVKDPKGDLEILSLPNQDCPLSQNLQPILTVDVWEHAYYLKYRNRRADYLSAWWHVVSWTAAEERFLSLHD